MKKQDRLVGIGGAATHLGLSRNTMYQYHSRGLLPAPDAYCDCEAQAALWRLGALAAWYRARKAAS